MAGIVTAIVGGALIGGAASYFGAKESANAIEDAANKSSDTSVMIYNDQRKRWEPYEEVGKGALPGLKGFDAAHPTPSFEDTVSKPMDAWNYEQSPAYKAKYTLGMEELNKQLQARGLAPSGVGATRAADLARNLTASDYNTERAYKTGSLTDLYKGRLAENTDRYNKILDQIKVGQGAAGQLGQAGNVYASEVGKNTMAAGNAQADFYSGLAGAPLQVANLGLKAYDTGQKGGWWGSSTPSFPQSNTGALPSQAELAPFDALYG